MWEVHGRRPLLKLVARRILGADTRLSISSCQAASVPVRLCGHLSGKNQVTLHSFTSTKALPCNVVAFDSVFLRFK